MIDEDTRTEPDGRVVAIMELNEPHPNPLINKLKDRLLKRSDEGRALIARYQEAQRSVDQLSTMLTKAEGAFKEAHDLLLEVLEDLEDREDN